MFGPLPEGLDNSVLEKMLQVAPCPEPLKEDTGEDNTGGRRPPTLPILTEGASVSMKEDDRKRKRNPGIRKPKLPNGRRSLPQRVLPWGALLPHKVRGGINSPASRK